MSEIPVSARARAISDSITLAITARAKAMRAEGHDVVSLGAGEPDFPTPEPIAEAGIQAIHDGYTRYTPASGMPEVRKAAAEWFGKHFGLQYEADEIVVTAGAKPALMLGLSAVVNDGDKVLLPAPFWASYPDIVRLAGGDPVPFAAVPEQGFIHTPEQIDRALEESGAKGIVFNFPNNPSGAVPSREQIEGLVSVCAARGVWILSDEIYARLLYDDAEHISPAALEQGRSRTIVVNGGTKSHSMTGWRVGFLAAPKEVAGAVGRLASQAMGNTCSISQRAALAVCQESDSSELERRLKAFDERRRFLIGAVNEIPGLSADMPRGAFYSMVDVRKVCEKAGIDDVTFAERLLVEGLVATVPGSAFEIPGFIRLSYAASLDDLKLAVGRLRKFVEALA